MKSNRNHNGGGGVAKFQSEQNLEEPSVIQGKGETSVFYTPSKDQHAHSQQR